MYGAHEATRRPHTHGHLPGSARRPLCATGHEDDRLDGKIEHTRSGRQCGFPPRSDWRGLVRGRCFDGLNRLAGIGAAAAMGVGVSLYLDGSTTRHASSMCNVDEVFNCDVVNTSAYSEIGGIPIAFLDDFYVGCVVLAGLASQFARRTAEPVTYLRCKCLRVALLGVSGLPVLAARRVVSLLHLFVRQCDLRQAASG